MKKNYNSSPKPTCLNEYIAIILPHSDPRFLAETFKFLTQLFGAASACNDKSESELLLRLLGSYTFKNKPVIEEAAYSVVVSWCNQKAMKKNWKKILGYAQHLKLVLDQESIGIIINMKLYLV